MKLRRDKQSRQNGKGRDKRWRKNDELLFAAAALLVLGIVFYFINGFLAQKGFCSPGGKEENRYFTNHKLKQKCVITVVPLMAVTFFLQMSLTRIWGPWSVMEGTVFQDYESFVAYMEQEIPYSPAEGAGSSAAKEVPLGDVTYYDESGREVSREESLRRTLADREGNVVCEYTAYSESVCAIRYSEKGGELLPITVFTYEDLKKAQDKVKRTNALFIGVYLLEIAALLGIYWKKRAKV